ncbi:MAG: ATP-binding protein [bacterium]
MEKILTSLLASFVAPQNLNQAIVDTIGQIGQHLALQRSYIMKLRPQENVLDNIHEWCAPGIPPRREELWGVPLASLPEWMEPLKKNQHIIFPEMKNAAFASSSSPFVAAGIQALLIIPLWFGGRFSGFIGFEDLSGPRDWRAEDIQSLKIAAGVYALAAESLHIKNLPGETSDGSGQEIQRSCTPAPVIAEELKNQLEAVFNCIADPLNIQDRSLTILMCNPARASLYNMHVHDVIGKKCYEIFQDRTTPCLSCAVIDAFQTGKPSYRLRYRESNERAASWAEVFAYPIYNAQGEVIQAVEFARDITQRKQAEDEIRKLYAELEQKVEGRTRELQKIQEELVHKEKLAVIGQLIGSVGHEFRSSLTILSGILYLLKNRGESENIEEFIDTLEEEIHKMSKFVEDLLDFSRTSAPTFQEVDLEKVIQKLRQKIDIPSQIQVFIDCPKDLPKAYVDPDHAEQIFHNIISNAIQAMPSGGTLRVRGKQEGSRVVLSFTDTGVGISPINIRKIFTPLFTTKAKGTGLGLSIVNMLIKKNKGSVSVESVPNQGTTFTLSFQTSPEPEKEVL